MEEENNVKRRSLDNGSFFPSVQDMREGLGDSDRLMDNLHGYFVSKKEEDDEQC
jgi:hypothetical protein